MSESGRVVRRHDDGRPGSPPGPPAAGQAAARPLLDDVEGLLDEIDEVLETNAEEFVRGYVQKGGE
jgi:prokaryotic ubiquitin-like protein Pup